MNNFYIIQQLLKNKDVFNHLLTGALEDEYLWKPTPEKWCLLEILCHLYDEEREDFRARTKHVLETPDLPLPMFDQIAWVTERSYIKQNYNDILIKFLIEREQSVNWLNSLHNPNWSNTYQHLKLGSMTAKLFLSNWLAHDYLHIRQIMKLKFDYLKKLSNEPLNYAGEW